MGQKSVKSSVFSLLSRHYLYTDNACTYQFYEHRGFERSEERQVVLDLDKRQVPLTCLFYTKKITEQ